MTLIKLGVDKMSTEQIIKDIENLRDYEDQGQTITVRIGDEMFDIEDMYKIDDRISMICERTPSFVYSPAEVMYWFDHWNIVPATTIKIHVVEGLENVEINYITLDEDNDIIIECIDPRE